MKKSGIAAIGLVIALAVCSWGCSVPPILGEPRFPGLATRYFEADSTWYLQNIPFLECSDKQIEAVYHYRWKLYKAHIRDIGNSDFVITEFIKDVPWDRDPFSSINAASAHHIYEGRWLKDHRYLDGYIRYLYQQGGNDRRYSEYIADAAWARFLVNADTSFIVQQLDGMQGIFRAWQDHYDTTRGLYYITPNNDATEFSAGSLTAGGGTEGWGGEAFRPTINSYMAANAQAIAAIALLKGDSGLAGAWRSRAETLQKSMMQLWQDSLQQFADRYRVSNRYVQYWQFARDRELAGFVPWMFSPPLDQPRYLQGWQYITDSTALRGQYGLRTTTPGYALYMKQFRINADGTYDCQWNGPSWPFQTCQVLMGMANLLSHYQQQMINTTDYLAALRQYTRQHYLPDGSLDLQENYDPDCARPIVGLERSHHYLHSTYNDLVITGLCGLRPGSTDSLEIHPLVDRSISYFHLGALQYHGHNISVVYDADGSRYGLGRGLSVWVDGKKAGANPAGSPVTVNIGPPVLRQAAPALSNLALNIRRQGYPRPSASVNNTSEELYKAIDGRNWYFTQPADCWSTGGSVSATAWYALDFGRPVELSSLGIACIADGRSWAAPGGLRIEYRKEGRWLPVQPGPGAAPVRAANTLTVIPFDRISTREIRVLLQPGDGNLPVGITELAFY